MSLPSSPLIDAVWDGLPEHVRDADDGTLYAYLGSVCGTTDRVLDLLASGEGMADPATVPAWHLPWVATMGGIDLTSVPDTEKRTFIAEEGSAYRGCAAAIRRRVGFTLTGSKTVDIVCPYSGDEMQMLVRTYTPETPDATATEAAIRAECPAWLQLTIEVADGIDYDALNTLYTDYADMTTNGGTYSDLSNTQPP